MRRLGPRECDQLRLEPTQTRSPAPRFEIELEIRIAPRRLGDRSLGSRRERGAPEIRVQQDAGRIDDGARMRRREPRCFGERSIHEFFEFDSFSGRFGLPSGHLLSNPFEDALGRAMDRPFRNIGGFCLHFSNQPAHRRQIPAGIRVDGSLKIHESQPQMFTRPCRFVFWIIIAGASAP